MAYKLMVQGTTKGAGKSFIVAGLVRAFSNLGFKVCPFKTVEITTDTFVTKEGAEISEKTATLSFAANTEPSVDMNPIVLKKTTDDKYHVLLKGELVSNMTMGEFLEHRKELLPEVISSVKKLEEEYDVIIFEGDKNPGELDQKEGDISNMGLAKALGIPVILMGNARYGGVMASLLGTVDFLNYEEKRIIKGLAINQYSSVDPISNQSIKQLEVRCGKPVLGMIPNSEIDPFVIETNAFLNKNSSNQKKENSEKKDKPIDIAVIKLPRMSKYPEFEKIEANEKFNVRYIKSVDQLKTPELLVIPGTKSTIPDLRWFKAMGFMDAMSNLPKSTKIFGICGGFQMLGREISDPYSIEGGGVERGLGYLPIRTTLMTEKTSRPAQMRLVNLPKSFEFLEKLTVSGEEVNGGEIEVISDVVDGRTFGTFIHGFFENDVVIKALERGFNRLDAEESDFEKYRDLQFDKCASLMDKIFDMEQLEIIMGMKKK